MFGGKKRRDREQQMRDAMQEAREWGAAAGAQNPQPGGQPSGHGPHARFEAMIESALEHNPVLAANPALANSVSDLIRAAREDPQGFKQRMRELAESGATPMTITPDGIARLTGHTGPVTIVPGTPPGPGTPQAPGTAPGTRAVPPLGAAPPPGTQPPVSPPGGVFSGQTSGGWMPPGTPAGAAGQFTVPPAGPFGGPPAQPAPQSSGAGAAPSPGNPLEELDKLAARLTRGEITDAEFEAGKRRILGG